MPRKYKFGEDPMADIYMNLRNEVPFTEQGEVVAFQHRDAHRNAYYHALLQQPQAMEALVPILESVAAGREKPQSHLLGIARSNQVMEPRLLELRHAIGSVDQASPEEAVNVLVRLRIKSRTIEKIYRTLRNNNPDTDGGSIGAERSFYQASVNDIVMHNRRLVFKTVKQRFSWGDPQRFESMYSEVLASSFLRAIEGFQIEKGNKFSTYASNAMNNELNRLWQLEKQQRKHTKEFSQGETIEQAYLNAAIPENPKDAPTSEYSFDELVLRACLDDREAEILRGRFGLEGPEQTQVELGARYRITKERIKQIEQRALQKLRWVA